MKEIKEIEKVESRYHSNKIDKKLENKGDVIPFTKEKLDGVFSFLRNHSNIKEEVNFTYSFHCSGDLDQLLQIENTSNRFYTNYSTNPWICFEFKKRRIIPSNYTIRSHPFGPYIRHPKTWVIEGSVDGNNWVKLDEQKGCSDLNGPNLVHTYPINMESSEKREFKFIKMRHTGLPWGNKI